MFEANQEKGDKEQLALGNQCHDSRKPVSLTIRSGKSHSGGTRSPFSLSQWFPWEMPGPYSQAFPKKPKTQIFAVIAQVFNLGH